MKIRSKKMGKNKQKNCWAIFFSSRKFQSVVAAAAVWLGSAPLSLNDGDRLSFKIVNGRFKTKYFARTRLLAGWLDRLFAYSRERLPARPSASFQCTTSLSVFLRACNINRWHKFQCFTSTNARDINIWYVWKRANAHTLLLANRPTRPRVFVRVWSILFLSGRKW